MSKCHIVGKSHAAAHIIYFLCFVGFEGERISHLDKLRDYKAAKQEEDREKKEQRLQDDYVLHRLFKKTGKILLLLSLLKYNIYYHRSR